VLKKDGYASNHTQVKVSVNTQVAALFKKACASSNISMASAINQFMMQFSGNATKKSDYSPDLSTRRQRKAAATSIIRLLERIRSNEEQYMENIPDNLQGGTAFANAEHCISILDEVIDLMMSAY